MISNPAGASARETADACGRKCGGTTSRGRSVSAAANEFAQVSRPVPTTAINRR